MPNFVSDATGKWHPAHEKVGLKNESDVDMVYEGKTIKPKDPFVYDGPDREAVKLIKEMGGEDAKTLGDDFRNNPEFIQTTRTMGFNSVEEYLKVYGYDKDKLDAEFKKKQSTIKSHEEPKKVDEIITLAGGKDRSGNKDNDLIGGFGEERMRKPSEVKKTSKTKK